MRRPTIALLLAVGVALAGCGGVAGSSADVAADKKLNGPPVAELMAEGPLGERALGNPNAPITVIEYASLTCPHCASFQRDVFPRVKKEFIDTGKIRFIVREFPIGRTSGAAAIATRCVPPEKYFQLYSAFLLRQKEWVSQEVRPDAIYSVAKSSGLSRAEFDKCATNSNHYRRADGGEAAGAEIWRGRHTDLLCQWPQGARHHHLRRVQGSA